MGMFTNYKNIPNKYIPNNQCQRKPDLTAERLPYELYDPQGNFIGYCWHYGDSVNLQFNIYDDVLYTKLDGYGGAFIETVPTFLETPVENSIKQAHLQIRDFRQCVVYEHISDDFITINNDVVTIIFPINYCKSSKLVRGSYTYNLMLETVHYVDNEGKVVPLEDVTEDNIRVVDETYTIPSDSSTILIK